MQHVSMPGNSEPTWHSGFGSQTWQQLFTPGSKAPAMQVGDGSHSPCLQHESTPGVGTPATHVGVASHAFMKSGFPVAGSIGFWLTNGKPVAASTSGAPGIILEAVPVQQPIPGIGTPATQPGFGLHAWPVTGSIWFTICGCAFSAVMTAEAIGLTPGANAPGNADGSTACGTPMYWPGICCCC